MQDTPFSFAPAETHRASEVIYNQIYQKIVDGELRNGDRLPPERELAEQFCRSRPSVREALRMLQQDGLIEIIVGSAGGPVVRGLSMRSVEGPLKKLVQTNAINMQELIEYRHINDRGCARLAAEHRTEQDIAEIERVLAGAKVSIDDPLSFQEHDIAFHTALAKASHNNLAILINDVIVSLNTRVLRDAIREFTPEQHRVINQAIYYSHNAILQAVIDGDPMAADRSVDTMVGIFQDIVVSNAAPIVNPHRQPE